MFAFFIYGTLIALMVMAHIATKGENRLFIIIFPSVALAYSLTLVGFSVYAVYFLHINFGSLDLTAVSIAVLAIFSVISFYNCIVFIRAWAKLNMRKMGGGTTD